MVKAPSIFIGHGAPLVAIQEDQYTHDLKEFSNSIPKPNAIISVSAHWEREVPLQVSSSLHPDQIYDFWGFPQELYEITYEPKGKPDLASKTVQLLMDKNIDANLDPNQGIDHGTWVPLSIMYPDADIPTIQLSVPQYKNPEYLIKMGEALSKLRDQNILLMGSGNIVHNLRKVRGLTPSEKNAPIEDWARSFDDFIATNLKNDQMDKLINYSEEADYANYAVPTTEHFHPLFFTLGAEQAHDGLTYISEEFQYRNISMRSIMIHE